MLLTSCAAGKTGGGRGLHDKAPVVKCEDQRAGLDFTPIDCPADATAACKAGNRTIDVDAFLNDASQDPTVCVIQGSSDVITWTSADHKNFRVSMVQEGEHGNGKPGSPFSSGPPFGPDANPGDKATVKSTPIGSALKKLDPGKCYVFKSQIKVPGFWGDKCYDPHIYVGCDGCSTVQ
ncbi:MAG TPA: hypothetical protein VFU76_10575 [Terriglobales bacterium]|nr:hypothetical protein [Terriglobales bacterium]